MKILLALIRFQRIVEFGKVTNNSSAMVGVLMVILIAGLFLTFKAYL